MHKQNILVHCINDRIWRIVYPRKSLALQLELVAVFCIPRLALPRNAPLDLIYIIISVFHVGNPNIYLRTETVCYTWIYS